MAKKSYWVARDKDTKTLFAYTSPPKRNTSIFVATDGCGFFRIAYEYEHIFEDVTWENSPKRIKVKCKRK